MKVFGMLEERQGRIFTTVVDDVSAETLMAEIQQHSEKGSVFYPDRFKSYKSLKFCGKHLMVNHGVEFAKGDATSTAWRASPEGIPLGWSFAKERLLKYHGVSQNHFYLYLKEMELRYNYRNQNLYQLLSKIHYGPVFN